MLSCLIFVMQLITEYKLAYQVLCKYIFFVNLFSYKDCSDISLDQIYFIVSFLGHIYQCKYFFTVVLLSMLPMATKFCLKIYIANSSKLSMIYPYIYTFALCLNIYVSFLNIDISFSQEVINLYYYISWKSVNSFLVIFIGKKQN